MDDDWRLRVELRESGFAHELGELLGTGGLEHDLERRFGDRVVVSVDGSELFCYTGSREQAERAEQLIRRLADENGWKVHVDLAHWHPAAEEWENPDAPLETPAEAREERVETEREESEERGYPEFEVRVECRNRGEAGDLSRRLRDEGIPNIHRYSAVLVGVADEEGAESLARRLRDEAPDARRVTVERNQRAIYDDLPRSPFWVLGGLGG